FVGVLTALGQFQRDGFRLTRRFQLTRGKLVAHNARRRRIVDIALAQADASRAALAELLPCLELAVAVLVAQCDDATAGAAPAGSFSTSDASSRRGPPRAERPSLPGPRRRSELRPATATGQGQRHRARGDERGKKSDLHDLTRTACRAGAVRQGDRDGHAAEHSEKGRTEMTD